LLLAGAAAAAEGYWACQGGHWTAIDAPAHPMPLKECGALPRTAPTTAERCADQGGKWGAIGIFPAPVCSLPTRDADRACGDSNECEGPCLAELSTEEKRSLMRGQGPGLSRLGKCAARVPVMGCVAKVERGVVRHVICFD
jgi:hypothetical protein